MIVVLELGGRNARAYLPRHITRALRHTNYLLENKLQEQHSSSQQAVSPAWWPFFFPPRDLALIHSHSSDVLAPKGPCPVVTEQLPSPPSLSYRPACSAKKKKKEKKNQDGRLLLRFLSHFQLRVKR